MVLSYLNQKTLLLLCLTSLASAQEYTPLVPMDEYKPPIGQSDDWRALDCWQCFEAQGRMCHQKYYESLWNLTQRANQGIGICCKLDATEGICAPNNPDISCSMKSYDVDANSTYREVISAGNRNYQMFAYCPMVN